MALCLWLACSSCNSINPDALSATSAGRPGLDLLNLRQRDANSCMLAVLASVSEHWGVETSEKALKQDLGRPPRKGYSLGQLRDWARDKGLNAFVFHGTADDLREQTSKGRPLIVVLRHGHRNHAVVVTGLSPEGDIIAMDPAKGKVVTILRDVFVQRWAALDNPVLLVAR